MIKKVYVESIYMSDNKDIIDGRIDLFYHIAKSKYENTADMKEDSPERKAVVEFANNMIKKYYGFEDKMIALSFCPDKEIAFLHVFDCLPDGKIHAANEDENGIYIEVDVADEEFDNSFNESIETPKDIMEQNVEYSSGTMSV